MKTKKRFAIIGCGKIAERHAAKADMYGELVAVCDILPEKANKLAAQYKASAYYSIESLIDQETNIDIAVVCTPNGLHATHSIQALEAGMNVLCEKPMAIRLIDAEEMITASIKANRQLFVVKQNRYNPPVTFVKELLTDNKLGNIHSFQLNCFWNRPVAYFTDNWRGTLALDGGTLYTQFSHFIDLLYWLLGDIKEASGIRANYMHKECVEFEDTGFASIKLKSGAIGTINYTINATAKNMEGSLTLFGEKGTVKIGGQYLNELDYFSVEGLTKPILAQGNPANQYGFYTGSMSNHGKVYENMLKALEDPSHPFIHMVETKDVTRFIETIYQSSPLIS
jgi:UDP-N-acetyl-2-amino-2-deoxyglucuronate dehydrogenase